jgi:hypothetical protein
MTVLAPSIVSVFFSLTVYAAAMALTPAITRLSTVNLTIDFIMTSWRSNSFAHKS